MSARVTLSNCCIAIALLAALAGWVGVPAPVLGSAMAVAILALHAAENARRKRTDESMRILDRIAAEAPHPIFIYDLDSRSIPFSNRATQQYLGSAGDLLSQPGFDLSRAIYPEDVVYWRATLESLAASSGAAADEIDIRVRNAAGVFRWLRLRQGVISRGPSGRVRQLLVTAEDVSERLSAADELHAKTELVNAAFDAIPVSLIVVSPEGQVLRWNKHSERIFGWTAAEAMGRYSPAVEPGKMQESRAMMESVAAGAELRGKEIVRRRKDGTNIDVAVWTAPVRDRNGHTVAIFSAFVDITEQKRHRLELERAQKLETVGRIAGGIAHDFNNILTIVNGYADLLAQHVDNPLFVAEGLKEIRAAGRTASDLTSKLLTFSRKQALEPKRVDIRSVVNGMTPFLSGVLGSSTRLEVDTQDRVEPVMADRTQLEQVVMNLALNARDAMPAGGTLRISVRGTPDRVCLEVADTGVGMSAETRARLFEPFFTTKEPGKGTGLGLSTVYGIVAQSGGAVSVDSAPGQGSTFRIDLPAAKPPL